MSLPTATPDHVHEFLARFMLEWEAAADAAAKAAVLARYRAAHPEMAEELTRATTFAGMLDQSRPQPAQPLPARIGEFEIRRRIHVSMDEVYEAWQPSLRRRVAVKTIRHGRSSPKARERFLRQQLVLAELHQTHIVPIFGAGEEGSLQYFVMPFIDGAPLSTVVRAAKELATLAPNNTTPPLAQLAERVAHKKPEESQAAGHAPPASLDKASSQKVQKTREDLKLSQAYFLSVAQVLADAADALQHAHAAGILHRDLKPSNLMVDRDGHCWIIDFGLAGYLARSNGDPAPSHEHIPPERPGLAETASLTPDGHHLLRRPVTMSDIMGTPHYMAPEQWDGHADARSDLWSLGATLYELLTLQRPFDGETAGEIRKRVQNEEPPRPRTLVPSVPPDLEAIALKAMKKKPEERYRSTAALADDLRRWLAGYPAKAHPAWRPRSVLAWARHHLGGAAAIITTVALVMVALLYLNVAAESARKSAKAAEAEAEREKINALLSQENLDRLRQGQTQKGWSKKAWQLVEKLASFKDETVSSSVRVLAAVSLIGLDCSVGKDFDEGASSVAFDRSGKRLLLGGYPTSAYLDGVNKRENKGRPARMWTESTGEVSASNLFGEGPVSFDPQDNPLILLADPKNPRTLRLWNVTDEKALKEFRLPMKDQVKSEQLVLALAANAATAAVAVRPAEAGQKSLIFAWDTASGKLLQEIKKPKVSALALSPDGKYLAIGEDNGEVTVWVMDQAKPQTTFKPGRLRITALAFGRNPRAAGTGQDWVLATGDSGGVIVIWEIMSPIPVSRILSPGFDVMALAFSPDGSILASSVRGEVRLWDVHTGKLLLIPGGFDFGTALAFSWDGSKLTVGNPNYPYGRVKVWVWDLEYGRGIEPLRGLQTDLRRLCLSPDGGKVAALSNNWEVAVWDLTTRKLLHIFLPPPGWSSDNAALAFSPNQKDLIFASGRKAVRWNLATGKVTDSWNLFQGLVDQLAFGDGKLLLFRWEVDNEAKDHAAGKNPDICRIYSLENGGKTKKLADIPDFEYVALGAADPQGKFFVAQGFGKGDKSLFVKVFSSLDGKELRSRKIRPAPYSVAVDPEGKWLAWAEQGNRFGLLELATGNFDSFPDPGLPQGLGPKAQLWVRPDWRGGDHFGLSLRRVGDKTPLVTFGIDHVVSPYPAFFNRAGNLLVWGTRDGTVFAANLPEVQRRLASLGLGWE